MDYQILHDEITTDPLTRGYGTMTDAEIVADLNTEYRTRNVESLTGDEAFQATDPTEFGALSDHQRDLWLSFCARDTIDPFGTANVELVQWIFGAGSATVATLADLRVEPVTRAEELDIGTVSENDIAAAREWGSV